MRIGSFIFGGLIGAAAALVLAPRTGTETRDELRRVWGKGRERLLDANSIASERIGALVDDIQDKSSKLLAASGDVAEAKRQDLMEAIQVAKRALAEQKEILMRSHRARRMAAEDTLPSEESRH